jgi:peptidoglycan/xylan/chitin deacetylase (PgdA/CDA1 family)
VIGSQIEQDVFHAYFDSYGPASSRQGDDTIERHAEQRFSTTMPPHAGPQALVQAWTKELLLTMLAALGWCVFFFVFHAPAAADGPPSADLLRYAAVPFEIRVPPALPAVPARIIHNGSRSEPRLALTFDACATKGTSGFDEKLIQVLVAKQIPATLFLGGKWMAEHPEATRHLAAIEQFELANHSFLHPRLAGLSEDRVRQELWWTQVVMYSLTGRQALLFRAPYAEIDERAARVAAQMGLTTVQYDLASGDPDASATAERLVKTVSQGARNGSIIVMHMNGRGWHTAEALPGIIDHLQGRGFAFATVGELIRTRR